MCQPVNQRIVSFIDDVVDSKIKVFKPDDFPFNDTDGKSEITHDKFLALAYVVRKELKENLQTKTTSTVDAAKDDYHKALESMHERYVKPHPKNYHDTFRCACILNLQTYKYYKV